MPELKKYANVNHQEWINTWSNLSFSDSFDDIYSKALCDNVNLINQIEKIIFRKGYIDKNIIYSMVPDRSAITGTKCGIKLPYINY